MSVHGGYQCVNHLLGAATMTAHPSLANGQSNRLVAITAKLASTRPIRSKLQSPPIPNRPAMKPAPAFRPASRGAFSYPKPLIIYHISINITAHHKEAYGKQDSNFYIGTK